MERPTNCLTWAFTITILTGSLGLRKTPATPPNSSGVTNKLWNFHPNSKLSHSNPSSAINRRKLLFNALLVLALSLVSSQKLGFFYQEEDSKSLPCSHPTPHFSVRILMTDSKYIRDSLQLQEWRASGGLSSSLTPDLFLYFDLGDRASWLSEPSSYPRGYRARA